MVAVVMVVESMIIKNSHQDAWHQLTPGVTALHHSPKPYLMGQPLLPLFIPDIEEEGTDHLSYVEK